MKYLLLLLIVGCASEPLTEDEEFAREYEEADRKVRYAKWEKDCLAGGGIIYSNNPHKPRIGENHIPHRRDWRYDSKREQPSLGNAVICISRGQLRDIFGL